MTQSKNVSEEAPQASPAALRDVRWLTAAIWGALLIALVVTSGYGITSFAQGSLSSRYIGLPGGNDLDTNAKATAVAGSVLSAIAALLLFAAWAVFAQATNRLLTALGNSTDSDEDAPVALDWIADSPGSAVMTLAGGVVRFLGAAWAVMVITPAILSVTTAFG